MVNRLIIKVHNNINELSEFDLNQLISSIGLSVEGNFSKDEKIKLISAQGQNRIIRGLKEIKKWD